MSVLSRPWYRRLIKVPLENLKLSPLPKNTNQLFSNALKDVNWVLLGLFLHSQHRRRSIYHHGHDAIPGTASNCLQCLRTQNNHSQRSKKEIIRVLMSVSSHQSTTRVIILFLEMPPTVPIMPKNTSLTLFTGVFGACSSCSSDASPRSSTSTSGASMSPMSRKPSQASPPTGMTPFPPSSSPLPYSCPPVTWLSVCVPTLSGLSLIGLCFICLIFLFIYLFVLSFFSISYFSPFCS